MPLLDQQLSAVFNAWLPFLFAVGAGWVVIWRVMLWRYREQYDKTKTLYEIAISHAELAAKAAKKTEDDLKSTIARQEERIEDLENQVQQLQQLQNATDEMKAAFEGLAEGIADLAKTSSIAREQVVKLGQANNAVSEAISDSRRLISWPPAVSMSPLGSPRPLDNK